MVAERDDSERLRGGPEILRSRGPKFPRSINKNKNKSLPLKKVLLIAIVTYLTDKLANSFKKFERLILKSIQVNNEK